MFNGTWIVNIYAPAGAEKKNERERFYNTDPTAHADMILFVSTPTQTAQAITTTAEPLQISCMDWVS